MSQLLITVKYQAIYSAVLLLSMPIQFCNAEPTLRDFENPPSTAPGLAELRAPVSPLSQNDDDRYGVFNLLDHRSIYGHYWFPEPLAADESDVDNEVRADWSHTESRDSQSDDIRIEVEKSFRLWTFEIAPRYESNRSSFIDPVSRKLSRETDAGFGNIELGARHPIYQFVSENGVFDTTFVVGMEVTIPSQSKISKDFELVPKLFNLTRIGDHLSIQSGVGNSILVGPVGRGLSTIEYGVTFGYELTKQELPIPFILSTVPIIEFDGERAVNQDEAGHNLLSTTMGFRWNFDSISWLPAQPRIGVGYTLPIDDGARNDFRWGVVTSVVFEY